jgi:flagella basal body P-ring formation protein FlgA
MILTRRAAPVTDAPGSPKATRLASPSWLDGRLVLGVLLVLVSVLVGAKVLAGADTSQQVWAASHDLSPGTVLNASDLELSKVRLFGNSKRYLTGPKPVGYVVLRGVGAQEFLPRDAVDAPGQVLQRRDVTVPVGYGHLPTDLAHGDVVDVYVTPDDKAAKRVEKGVDLTHPRLVLTSIAVSRVTRASGLSSGGQQVPVILTVDPAQVLALVQAMADGPIDLVRVPRANVPPLVGATPPAAS